MLFNSIEFLIFFPIVTLLFYLLKHEYRWMMLLLASCIFYMFFIPQYILILAVTILIDYYAALYIERTEGKAKKNFLILSIVATCLVLIIFKYLNFFNENIMFACQRFGISYNAKVLDIVLPIGLSFHTFQSLSYVIEVYRGNQKPERNFGIYSLYVMFYPQLVTGPIERPQNLLRQLREVKIFQNTNVIAGLSLILFGLFAKMVIADNLGEYVDMIYAQPEKYNSFHIATGLIFYSFQIYCDFFGYSTIAVGCAKLMGFDLIDNFKNPYFSSSLGEFWQRWHISLSTWFRDYVYFSLGGNKVKLSKWILNILIVFTLSGFWHGASWTFVLWGLAHGIYYIIESKIFTLIKFNWTNGWLLKFEKFIRVATTFIVVTFIWILFRATDLHQVKLILKSLLLNFNIQDEMTIKPLVLVLFLGFLVLDKFLLNTRFDYFSSKLPWYFRWLLYSILIYSVIVFSSVENYPFIYFQF